MSTSATACVETANTSTAETVVVEHQRKIKVGTQCARIWARITDALNSNEKPKH